MLESNIIQETFKDKDYCMQQILEARKIMTSKERFTEEVAESLFRGLWTMYLYCPDEVKSLVTATIQELEKRQYYLLLNKK